MLDEDIIIEMYTDKLIGFNTIAREFKVAPLTIRKILVKHGISIRSASEQTAIKNRQESHKYAKYTMNEEYFAQWSSNMAYVLGLLTADASINDSKVKLSLAREDRVVLELIKDDIQYTGTIYDSQAKCNGQKYPISVLQLQNWRLAESLSRYGIVSNRKATIEFPDVPCEFECDFIRGVFDGDGWVKKGDYLRTGFCARNEIFLKQLQDRLVRYGLPRNMIYKHKTAECYYLEYAQEDSLLLYQVLYNNNPQLYIPRKKSDFDSYI